MCLCTHLSCQYVDFTEDPVNRHKLADYSCSGSSIMSWGCLDITKRALLSLGQRDHSQSLPSAGGAAERQKNSLVCAVDPHSTQGATERWSHGRMPCWTPAARAGWRSQGPSTALELCSTNAGLQTCTFMSAVINLLVFEDRETISICENFLQSYFLPWRRWFLNKVVEPYLRNSHPISPYVNLSVQATYQFKPQSVKH